MNVIRGDKLRLPDMRAVPIRSRRAFRTVVPAAAFLVLVACSNGDEGKAQRGRETTTTSAPATSSTTSTTIAASSTLAVEAAVLADYTAAKTTLDQAQQIPDPSYPALPEHWTGEGLKEVRRQLLILQTNGWVIRGTTTRNPRVISVKDSTAVVWDCIQTDGERYKAKTGEVINPTGPLTLGFEETLLQEAGAWKISARVNQEQACAGS